MSATSLLGLLAALLGPGVAAAAEEHGGAPSIGTLLLPSINFALFAVLFARYVWPILKGALAERRKLVEKDLAEAERAIAEAEGIRRDVEARRARLRDEGQRLVADLRSEAEREREALLEAARKTAERIRADARAVGDQETARAARQIREEIGARVIERVTAEVTKRLRDADQGRFVEEFFSGVESGDVR